MPLLLSSGLKTNVVVADVCSVIKMMALRLVGARFASGYLTLQQVGICSVVSPLHPLLSTGLRTSNN